jgi:hypothetical protein
VIDLDEVTCDLRAAAEVCGPATVATPALRWGALLAELDTSATREYVTAMELIYEGYLVHYRRGRVRPAPPDKRRDGLLSGDVLYARGLHMIAAHGDVVAVGVLARLMASCSSLRGRGAPFSDDDALWAYTVGGLAVVSAGASAACVFRFFDEVDAILHDGRCVRVREMARVAAADLPLPRREALEAELNDVASPSAPPAASTLAPVPSPNGTAVN